MFAGRARTMAKPITPDRPASTKVRLPQQDRSAVTRTRLLDATIQCLLERGYAGTTTLAVCKIAGVSRGGQLHHFPTRETLLVSAAEHFAHEVLENVRKKAAQLAHDEDPVSSVLSLLWEQLSGPFFTAGYELWVAARTDPSLRKVFAPIEQNMAHEVRKTCEDLFPATVTRREHFVNDLACVFNMLQGLALTRTVRVNDDLVRHTLAVGRLVLLGEPASGTQMYDKDKSAD